MLYKCIHICIIYKTMHNIYLYKSVYICKGVKIKLWRKIHSFSCVLYNKSIHAFKNNVKYGGKWHALLVMFFGSFILHLWEQACQL